MKLQMFLFFGVLAQGMNNDFYNNGNRLIVESQEQTTEMNSNDPEFYIGRHVHKEDVFFDLTEMNSNDPDLTGKHMHEEDVFYDAFSKPEAKKEAEEQILREEEKRWVQAGKEAEKQRLRKEEEEKQIQAKNEAEEQRLRKKEEEAKKLEKQLNELFKNIALNPLNDDTNSLTSNSDLKEDEFVDGEKKIASEEYLPEAEEELDQTNSIEKINDAIPKPESSGVKYEGERNEKVLDESKKSRTRIIEELVTDASPLTQYGWTSESIKEFIAQKYDYDCDGSTKIDRCKEWIRDTLKDSEDEAMNNMQIDAENTLKHDQIRNKIKDLFNDDGIMFFEPKTHPRADTLKPYEMKVDACKPKALVRDKLNWLLKNNCQGLKLTQNLSPLQLHIELITMSYLTLREQIRVGQACTKLYNRHCANNQHFTVSTGLASKCECGLGFLGNKAKCKCDKYVPHGFYSMPPVDEFDKMYISLYDKENEDRHVRVHVRLEDESGDFKSYCTVHRKIDFEIWKMPGKNGFKVVKGNGWNSEVTRVKERFTTVNKHLGRLFKVENLSSWGQKNKPIEMEIHFYKSK